MTTKDIYSIYKATNLINNKSYIGFTNNHKIRKRDHLSSAKSGSDNCPKFYRSIRKYGPENFTWELLWQSPCKGTALLAEYYYINIFDSIKNGLNCTAGGNCPPSWKGTKFSKQRCLQISKSMMGKKNHMYGKHHTEETKKYLSKINSGVNSPRYGDHTPNDKKANTYKVNYKNNTFIIENLNTFCKEHNFNYNTAKSNIQQNKPYKGYSFTKIN